jgi:hypothetical protein
LFHCLLLFCLFAQCRELLGCQLLGRVTLSLLGLLGRTLQFVLQGLEVFLT